MVIEDEHMWFVLACRRLILSGRLAPGLFFLRGFFLQIEESGSPQILILPIAESSVVHKILLKLFQRISIDLLWKI